MCSSAKTASSVHHEGDAKSQTSDRDRVASVRRGLGRLVRLSEIIEEHGLDALPRDSVDHLEDKLWELRIRGKSGITFEPVKTSKRA